MIDKISCICLLQYFLPFAREGINNQIEQAILRADRIGVKVISLAALNKVGIRFMFCLVVAITSSVMISFAAKLEQHN